MTNPSIKWTLTSMESQPQSLPESLTVTQAAKMLGCSAQSLRLWEKQGKIRPSYRTIGGGHRRYYRKDIEALIAQRHAHAEENSAAPRLLTDPLPRPDLLSGS